MAIARRGDAIQDVLQWRQCRGPAGDCMKTKSGSGLREKGRSETAISVTLRAIRTRWRRMAAISAALLVPCFWHTQIEAGDLGSHAYNAWLAQLIEKRDAPGLYIARQWDNVMFDAVLLRLGGWVGFVWAQKIAVAACVLIFFWGAFAFISATARRAPWFLAPGIAMIAYGWTFQMGFMNYYLSLGFAFGAAALFWRGRGADWVAGIALAALAFVAHPLGLLWLVGILVYVKAAEALRGGARWFAPAAAVLAILGTRNFIDHRFRIASPETTHFYFYTGADQIVLFGARYAWLAIAMIALGAATCLFGAIADRARSDSRWGFRVPLELWALSLFAAAILPDAVFLPQYAAPAALLIPRLTSTTAVLALCLVGCIEPRWWHLFGLTLCAMIFFTWIYQDTGRLNGMEAQADALVSGLPPGQRVIASIWFPLPAGADTAPAGTADAHFFGTENIGHIADRACIGRCFSYANYEPSSRQFRVRIAGQSPIVTNSADDASLMQNGRYVVRPEDLPMAQICQCDAADRTKLCLRELKAGDVNGQGCYRPPHL